MRWIGIIFFLLFLTGCRQRGHNAPDSDSVSSITAGDSGSNCNDMTGILLEKTDSVLSSLTLEQKVGQCFMPSIFADASEKNINKLKVYISDLCVGGVVLLKGTLNSAAVMASIGREARVPLFIAIDAEWGLGMRLTDAPDFPKNGSLSPEAGEELLYDYGEEVARECRRVGINMVLGPVVDVVENPDGVIGNRSFGNNPERVADLGVAYAKGLESGNVMSVAKHFPGHGSPATDSHRGLPVIERSLHLMDSIDLYPFRHYIEAGLNGIMVGHLSVPAIDPKSLPAAVSPIVIGDLLRDELGFKGLVLTDALNMGAVEGYGAYAALVAGADIVVSPADTGNEIRTVIEMVRKGKMDVSVIEDRCRRIIFYKFLTGAFGKTTVSLQRLREDVSNGADSLYDRLSRPLSK